MNIDQLGPNDGRIDTMDFDEGSRGLKNQADNSGSTNLDFSGEAG